MYRPCGAFLSPERLTATSGFGTSRTSGTVRFESAKWCQSGLDQVAVSNRDFMSTRRNSNLPPARLTGIHQRQIDRRDSKQRDHRWLLRIALHAVVVGRVSDAPHEPSGRDRHGLIGVEVGAAVHRPRAGKDERET